MRQTLRETMGWFHTWIGLGLGLVIFAVFWTGSLSLFDREIDRWMMPETRLEPLQAPPSLDRIRAASRQAMEGQKAWFIITPDARRPVTRVGYFNGDDFTMHRYQGQLLTPLPEARSWGATGFLVPFHYSLHIELGEIGHWVVGLAGAVMVTLCLSGLIIHRKLIAEFFLWRSWAKGPRRLLDLHNLCGVMGLPFFLIISISGIAIFAGFYFPNIWQAGYGNDREAFLRETFGHYGRPAAGHPGPVASLDAMAAQAQNLWEGGPPGFVRVWYAGDAQSFVEMAPDDAHQVSMVREIIYFDGSTGEMLHHYKAAPVMGIQRYLVGLHFFQFDHWPLRWSFFVLGLAGCVVCSTGYRFWLAGREKYHRQNGVLWGHRVVEALSSGGVLGLVAATFAYFVINRLLPSWMPGTRWLEGCAFYAVWFGAMIYAACRPLGVWRPMLLLCGGLAWGAVALNGLSTGYGAGGGAWGLSGMDWTLIVAGGLGLFLWWKKAPANTPATRVKRGRG